MAMYKQGLEQTMKIVVKFTNELGRKEIKACKAATLKDDGMRDDLKQVLRSGCKRSKVALLLKKGKLAGWALMAYMWDGDSRPWVEVFIYKKYRSRGWASKLMQALEIKHGRFTAYSDTSYRMAIKLKKLGLDVDVYRWYEYDYLDLVKDLEEQEIAAVLENKRV